MNKYDTILDAYREDDATNLVTSFNGLTGAIVLAAGTNITLTPSGNTITIAATNDSTAVWGSITGTLSNQTDLQTELTSLQDQIDDIDSSVTLADVSANSTTAPLSLYTMTSTIPVEFRSSDGNTLLYLDETNERIGIGISTPDGKLHVHSATAGAVTASASFDDLVVENSGAGGMSILVPDASYGTFNIGSPTSNAFAYFEGRYSSGDFNLVNAQSGGFIRFYTNGGSITERMRITSTGTVGIGETSPSTTLHIKPASGDAGLRIHAQGGNDALLQLQAESAGGSQAIIQFGDNVTLARGRILYDTNSGSGTYDVMSFSTASTIRWQMDASGNLIAGTDNAYDIGASGATRPRTGYFGTALALGGTPASTGTLRLNNAGSFKIRNAGNTADFEIITVTASDVLEIGTGTLLSSIVFNENGSDTDFRIESDTDANMFFVDAGNNRIGIGTASPAAGTTLHVDASGGAIIRATRLASGAGVIQLEADGTDGTLTTTNQMLFRTNAGERMRIDTSGNVGISDTTPINLLTLRGSTIGATNASVGIKQSTTGDGFGSQSSINDDFVRFYHSGTIGFIESTYQSTGGYTPLAFGTSNVERMRIDNAGLVGIGTTVPGRALEINSATGINLRLTYNDSNGSATNYADLLTTSGGNLTITPSGGTVALGTSTLTMTGSLAATGARVTKGWFTDIESTNMPTVGGTSLSSTFAPIASPTFTGTVTIPAAALNGQVNLDGTPASDHSAVGPVTNTFNAGYSSAIGDLVFMGSGGKWLEVDADAVATCNGLMGIALEAKNDTEAMLVALPGSFVRDDTWNWTVGATLYAGETLGLPQEAIPTGADAIIKVIGFAVSADVIFFNPSPDQQSVVA